MTGQHEAGEGREKNHFREGADATTRETCFAIGPIMNSKNLGPMDLRDGIASKCKRKAKK
jgi:hypothetical protein